MSPTSSRHSWQAARDRLLGMISFWSGCALTRIRVDLQTRDVDAKRELLLVREGKGRKARYVPIDSDVMRPALLEYLYLRPAWAANHLWIGRTNDTALNRQALATGRHPPNSNPALPPSGHPVLQSARLASCFWDVVDQLRGQHDRGESLAMGHSSVQCHRGGLRPNENRCRQREYAAAVAYIKRREKGAPPLW